MKSYDCEFDIIIFEIKKCLIIPIKYDLYDAYLEQLRVQLLKRIVNSTIKGVIIDFSSVKLIDSLNFQAIIELCKMIRLLGKETVIIGLQPTVTAALQEFTGLNFNRVNTFLNLKLAIRFLEQLKVTEIGS
ncbi:MAG: STAS domain-containing protein [Gammaproteobacteria bacterium]|nr:MAG: STAS domain-containing protein [Gammaproteobacteria bacterium]